MPASKLKTAAGVDHDYNFLSAIERERDRNHREIVEDRGLFSEKQLREMDEPKRWRRMWFGEEVRFVSTDRTPRGPRAFGSDGEGGDDDSSDNDGNAAAFGGAGKQASALARRVRQRLDQANIDVVHMPVGMVRQRENTTAWNRNAGIINWCVEWLVYQDNESLTTNTPTRIRHKALETTPVYKALGNSLAWYNRGQKKDEHDDEEDEELLTAYARKRRRTLIKEVKEENRRSAMQDSHSDTWLATAYPTQNPYTATWDLDRTSSITSWLPDEAIAAKRDHKFLLLKPLTPAGKPKELIPLESEETLGHALGGRTVLEFPTIYVLPLGGEARLLPDGFVLGSTERRRRQRRPKSEKRKITTKDEKKSEHSHKRQALDQGQGIPIRGGRHQRGRGRGGGARGRGRGGRFQQRHGGQDASDAEEGEVNSDGVTMVRRRDADPADTTSSDSDMSNSEDRFSREEDGMDVDGASGEIESGPAARSATNEPGPGLGLGLVDYGSESDDGSDGGEDEGVDLAELKPENPELVASAIQEIVGLLT